MIDNDFPQDYRRGLTGFQRRIETEVAMLLYHGVTEAESRGIENYSRKHLSRDEFLAHMVFLKENCHPISISDFLSFQENGERLPPRSVIVSFDDGFRNNFTVAAPILDEMHIPAVFYISSGIVNTTLMFWVDVLEDCLNLTRKRAMLVRLGADTEFSLETDAEKIHALASIKDYCKAAGAGEKDRVLSDVSEATGVQADVSHSTNYEKLSWQELRVMHANTLFTIGGHSLYHDVLSAFAENRLQREIRVSLDLLEINLDTHVIHYSYPEGQANHYNDKAIYFLKKNGIVCSPSAIPGLNTLVSDPFHLRRIMVGFNGVPFPFWDNTL